MNKFGLPRIGDIKWINNDLGYQVVVLSAKNEASYDPALNLWKDRQGENINRGCVKIWYNDSAGRRVVDRALTVKVARRRIRQMKSLLAQGEIL